MTNPTEPTTSKLDQLVAIARIIDDSGWVGWSAVVYEAVGPRHLRDKALAKAREILALTDQSAEASLARMTEERDAAVYGLRQARDAHSKTLSLLHIAEASLSQLQADATLTADMNVRNVLFRKGTLLSAVESVLTGWYDEITAARNPQADAGGERLRAALEKIEEIAKNCGPDSGVREGTFGDGVAAGLRQAADVASLALSGGTEKQGLSSSVARVDMTQEGALAETEGL